MRDLVDRSEGLERGEEDALRAERERMRHGAELADGAVRATAAIAPDEGEGAAALADTAERALAPLTRLAPELEAPAAELRELAVRLNEVGSDLHRFVASLEADPARVEAVEERLDLIAELRRRFAVQTLDELLERRAHAVAELDALDGSNPLALAEDELARAEQRFGDAATRTAHGPEGRGRAVRGSDTREPRRRRDGGGRVPRRAAGTRSRARRDATRPSS